jgi:hypothetical protein
MYPEWHGSESRAGRAERSTGRRQANRRLQIAAIVILGAALMVGSGAFASQGGGGQPFGGLLAGGSDTPAAEPTPTPSPDESGDSDEAPADGESEGDGPSTTTPSESEDESDSEDEATGAGDGSPPSADSTGVPAGVALEPFAAGDINQAGVTVSGLAIDGCVTVNASNVTIRNTRITCDGPVAVLIAEGVTGVVLEDIEIDGAGNPEGIGVAPANYTVRRADISNLGEGLRLGSNTLVEDSFVHDLVPGGGGGVQSTGGTGIVVLGNTIDYRNAQNPAVHIGATQADIGDALIEGNWLNGGVVTVAAGAAQGFTAEGVQVVDNTFGRGHAQGPLDIADDVVWDGNVYIDDGSEITP